jgi:hypothetical protein
LPCRPNRPLADFLTPGSPPRAHGGTQTRRRVRDRHSRPTKTYDPAASVMAHGKRPKTKALVLGRCKGCDWGGPVVQGSQETRSRSAPTSASGREPVRDGVGAGKILLSRGSRGDRPGTGSPPPERSGDGSSPPTVSTVGWVCCRSCCSVLRRSSRRPRSHHRSTKGDRRCRDERPC